jgi:hypothetical protein
MATPSANIQLSLLKIASGFRTIDQCATTVTILLKGRGPDPAIQLIYKIPPFRETAFKEFKFQAIGQSAAGLQQYFDQIAIGTFWAQLRTCVPRAV